MLKKSVFAVFKNNDNIGLIRTKLANREAVLLFFCDNGFG